MSLRSLTGLQLFEMYLSYFNKPFQVSTENARNQFFRFQNVPLTPKLPNKLLIVFNSSRNLGKKKMKEEEELKRTRSKFRHIFFLSVENYISEHFSYLRDKMKRLQNSEVNETQTMKVISQKA